MASAGLFRLECGLEPLKNKLKRLVIDALLAVKIMVVGVFWVGKGGTADDDRCFVAGPDVPVDVWVCGLFLEGVVHEASPVKRPAAVKSCFVAAFDTTYQTLVVLPFFFGEFAEAAFVVA